MNPITVEGHRGCCAAYPENTLPSYRAAIKLGVEIREYAEDGVRLCMERGASLITASLPLSAF